MSQAVRAAVRRRLGLTGPLGAPLPRGGAEEAATPRGRVRVCFDRVYPKPGAADAARDGIVALTRKRSPDATVEWWPTGGQPVVMAVDATWSRNPNYHDDKLGYARSLAAGGSDEMLGAPRLCTRRSLVVFPGPRPESTSWVSPCRWPRCRRRRRRPAGSCWGRSSTGRWRASSRRGRRRKVSPKAPTSAPDKGTLAKNA